MHGGTTHHGMELAAAIEGLRRVSEGDTVEVVSDSTYVVDGLELGFGARSAAYREQWASSPSSLRAARSRSDG